MKKGMLLFVIFVVLFLGGVFYLYNFQVLKTIRICVGEPENLGIPCNENLDCVKLIKDEIGDAPPFIRENFDRVIYEIIYCEESCFLRNVRGVNLERSELELLDSCELGEKEILIDVRGKDCLEIWKWFESQRM